MVGRLGIPRDPQGSWGFLGILRILGTLRDPRDFIRSDLIMQVLTFGTSLLYTWAQGCCCLQPLVGVCTGAAVCGRRRCHRMPPKAKPKAKQRAASSKQLARQAEEFGEAILVKIKPFEICHKYLLDSPSFAEEGLRALVRVPRP